MLDGSGVSIDEPELRDSGPLIQGTLEDPVAPRRRGREDLDNQEERLHLCSLLERRRRPDHEEIRFDEMAVLESHVGRSGDHATDARATGPSGQRCAPRRT